MTLEERDQLQNFLRQLLQSRAAPKDVAAETLIKQACSQQADALYLLVQRAMASELAFVERLPNPAAFTDISPERALKVLVYSAPT